MFPEILALTLEHLKLVAITVAIAAALGIPGQRCSRGILRGGGGRYGSPMSGKPSQASRCSGF